MSNKPLSRRGLMLVLSSPSGAGKTTISRALLQGDDNLALSVSATTRPPREGEVDGVHYHFTSEPEFQELVDSDGLLEWATVFKNSYGTPRATIETALDEGRDVLFDIDWQGTQQLRQKMPQDLVSVFVLPPSLAALMLRSRSKMRAARAAFSAPDGARMPRAAHRGPAFGTPAPCSRNSNEFTVASSAAPKPTDAS